MTHLTNLRVFNQARANIRALSKLCDQTRNFGDIKDQAKRAAVSVVSNIAEGHGSSSKPQTLKFFKIARASNHELYAQILVIADLHPNKDLTDILDETAYVGKMLTRFIQSTV